MYEKICPVSKASCSEKCGWFDKCAGECSLLSLSKSLKTIAECNEEFLEGGVPVR